MGPLDDEGCPNTLPPTLDASSPYLIHSHAPRPDPSPLLRQNGAAATLTFK